MAGIVGDGNFDGGVCFVAMAAVKTEAAFGNIFTLDDFLAGGTEPDASGEIDASADVAAQIEFAAGGEFGLRGSRGRGWRFFDGDGCGPWHEQEFTGRNEFITGDGSAGVSGLRRVVGKEH